jgi:hypothetical protein
MDIRSLVGNVVSLAFIVGAGARCFWVAIKKGFIEQRMQRRGEIFEGPDAVRAGVFYMLLGGFAWSIAVYWVYLWKEGRIRW